MIPYAHQGPRSGLTFTLPVSKWLFALTYGLSMLLLLIIQHVVMLCAYGMIFGFSTFLTAKFPWSGFVSCLLLETLAFEVFAFGFALSSMTFGQIPTFFLGSMVFVFMQLAGAFFNVDLTRYLENPPASIEVARGIYRLLPPLGEIVFDLRHGFSEPSLLVNHSILWAVWLGILVALFRWKLRFPSRQRSAEG